MNNLEVITLTKHILKEAIAENKYWNGTFDPPFSKNKAKWMIENNRAQNDDVFAILGYENNTLIAFVSLMPDLIKIEDGSFKKVFWSQRWWVADKYKNTVLPTYVKSNSLIEANNQVIVRFLGDNTKTFYDKQPFAKFSERSRYITVFNLDHKILISKKNIFKKAEPLLKLLDKISYKFISFLNMRKSKKNTNTLSYEYFSSINDTNWKFINSYCSNDIVPKTLDYVNWQISNEQYHLVKTDEEAPDYKCLLESISSKIYNLNFMVKKEGVSIGFVSGLVRGRRFILRYFLTNENNFEDCANSLMFNILESKCAIFQTENDDLGKLIKDKYLNVYTDSKPLMSLVHNSVNLKFEDATINDRDGNFI